MFQHVSNVISAFCATHKKQSKNIFPPRPQKREEDFSSVKNVEFSLTSQIFAQVKIYISKIIFFLSDM
jgi:hypothetical protein